MTKATTKNGKVTTTKNGKNLDAVNKSLANELSSTFSLDAELVWFEKALEELKAGAITGAGLKATIEESEKVGFAPTIRASHVQDFILAGQLREKSGGKSLTLKALFNACVQARKSFGGKSGAIEKIEKAKNAGELVASIPSQGARAKARGAGKTGAEKSQTIKGDVNTLIKSLTLALKENRGGKVNLQALEELADIMNSVMYEIEEVAA